MVLLRRAAVVLLVAWGAYALQLARAPLSRRNVRVLLRLAVVALLMAWGAYALQLARAPSEGLIPNVDPLLSTAVAKQLLAGEGFRTPYMSLFEVGLYHEKGILGDGPPWPTGNRAPLAALVRVPLVAMFDDSLFVATSLFTIIMFLLTLLLLVEIGRGIFRSFAVGIVAGAIWTTTPLLLFLGIQGREAVLDAFLILLLFYLTVRAVRAQIGLRTARTNYLWWGLLGAALGTAILGRPNVPVFTGVVLAPYVVFILWRVREKLWPGLFVPLLFTGACAFLVVLPMAAYKLTHFGTPFFSTNLLMQPTAFSLATKYMNPWWKLTYPFQWSDGFGYFTSHLADFTERFVLLWQTLPVWFFLGGTTGTGFAFWWPWAGFLAAVLMIVRKWRLLFGVGTDSEGDSVWLLLAVLAVVTMALQFFLQPAVNFDTELQWYLLGPLALLAARPIVDLWHHRFVGSSERSGTDDLAPASHALPGSHVIAELAAVLLIVNIAWYWGIRGNVVEPPFAVNNFFTWDGVNYLAQSLRALLTWPWASVPGLILIVAVASNLLERRRWLLWVTGAVVALGAMSMPLAHFGSGGSVIAATQVPRWLTPSTLEGWMEVERLVPPGKIVLSPLPWAPYYYANRPGLALSEFPDEVLVLEHGFDLDIGAVYLPPMGDPGFFLQTGMAYTYQGYLRMAAHAYTFPGYRIAFRNEQGVLYLKEEGHSYSLKTDEIEFLPDDASHLMWGWGPSLVVDGKSVAWVIRDQELGWLVRPGVGFTSASGNSGVIGPSTAEISFFVDMAAPPYALRLTVQTPRAQFLTLVLNANRAAYGEQGALLGGFTLDASEAWHEFAVDLPSDALLPGLNTLAFLFSDHSNNLYAVFDKIEFLASDPLEVIATGARSQSSDGLYCPPYEASLIDFGTPEGFRHVISGFRGNERDDLGRTWNWLESPEGIVSLYVKSDGPLRAQFEALTPSDGQRMSVFINELEVGAYEFAAPGVWEVFEMEIPLSSLDESGCQLFSFRAERSGQQNSYVAFDTLRIESR